MIKVLRNTALLLLALSASQAAWGIASITVTVTGAANTTPALSSTYTSLSGALTAVNAVTAMSGPVSLAVSGAEYAPATGFVIGSTSLNAALSATNTLTITGPATITAGVGTATPTSAAPDGMLSIQGADYVTLSNLTLTDANTTNPATMEFGIGLFKQGATDGANNNTISNCTINMQRVNNASATAPLVEGAVGIGIYNSTATAATTALTPTAASGSNSRNKIYGNTVNGGNYGVAIMGYTAASPYTLADQNNDIGGSSVATGNTILNFGGGGSNQAGGIRTIAQYGLSAKYNTINNNNGSGVDATGFLKGILIGAANGASVTASYNTINVISSSTSYGIENTSGSLATDTSSFTNNTITNSTSSNGYTIYNSAATGVLRILDNVVTLNSQSTGASPILIYNTGFVKTTTLINGNTTALYHNAATLPANTRVIYVTGGAATCSLFINNNIFNAVSLVNTGTSSIYCIQVSATVLGSTISGNQFNNLNINNTSSIYAISNNYSAPANGFKTIQNNIVTGLKRTAASGGNMYFYNDNGNSPATVTYTISGNVVTGLDNGSASTGNTAGIYIDAGTMHMKYVYNNAITNINGGVGSAYGIYLNGNNGTSASPSLVYNNLISGITNGSGAVFALFLGDNSTYVNTYGNTVRNITCGGEIYAFVTQGGTLLNTYNNRIYNLTATGPTSLIEGMSTGSATLTNLYNNFISGLSAPAATSADAITGLSITNGSTNVLNNTIYPGSAGALSGGTGFGASGIYISSTAGTHKLRNNIINISGTGSTGYIAALRLVSGTAGTKPANITATNNVYYAPYIYGEGSTLSTATNVYYVSGGTSGTADPTFSSACGGLYRAFMNETNTYYENNLAAADTAGTFKPTGSSYAEGQAMGTVPAVTTDYAGTTRGAFTDIGALEFAGTAGALTLPAANATQTANVSNTTFMNTGCEVLGGISPTGASPVSGTVTTNVYVYAGAQTYASRPYVGRVYEITPAANAATATATIRLYYTQAEFDAYNVAAASVTSTTLPLLPTGGADNGNVRITQYHGTGTTPNLGTPVGGNNVFITPVVSWDATNSVWVVTFPVTGFSGFALFSTSDAVPLPVTITSLTARNTGAVNVISWNTAEEKNITAYEVQHSADGKAFAPLTTVTAKGEGSYTITDKEPVQGINYYRLRIKELNGAESFSRTVTATAGAGTAMAITAVPNPASDKLTISITGGSGNGQVHLKDMYGRTVATIHAQDGKATLNTSALAAGSYVVVYSEGTALQLMRITKQ